MKIGFDAKFIRGNHSGNAVFTECLLRALARVDKANEYVVYRLNTGRIVQGPNFTEKRMSFLHRFPQMRQLVTFPLELRLHPVDIYHGIYTLPYYTSGKMLLSLIEFFWITHPEEFPMSRFDTAQRIMATTYAIKRADRIITPTDYVRSQLLEHFDIPEYRVRTVPLAFDEFYLVSPAEDDVAFTLRKFGIDRPYLFSVGNLHTRKNFDTLIEAFRILRLQQKIPHKLVIAGGFSPEFDTIRTDISDPMFREHIVFPGYVTKEELKGLYRGADVFVFPSLKEGFGLPLLEAMASRVPIAASRISSIPEVGGDAAVYFDPRDREDMAEVLYGLLASFPRRNDLIENGKKRIQLFSWDASAQETVRVYEELA